MGVGTLLGQALVALANLQSLEKVAVSLGAGMPIGLSVMVYALSEGLDAELAAGTISLSILVGLFWLPLLLSITGTVV
jgi:predicted permease